LNLLMRQNRSALAAGFVLMLVPAALSAQTTVPGWHKSLKDATRRSAETGKPIFLVFRCVR